MSEILSKLFQHPNSTKLAAYKLIQDANPNPSNPEEWLSKFRSSAEKSVQSAALQYRKAPAGERLNNDEAMAITGQTLDMLFTDSKERWSPQNKMLWRTFMELYSVAPKIAGKREMLNKTLEFYYKKGFDGAQQTMQTTQPIQQPQSRPTTGIYSVERVIKTHRDLQAQVESHPERQFPAGFIKKRTVDGPLWVPLIVENGCFYTKNPDVIASAMGGGDEHLTEIMEGKARQLAAGNEKQVGVVIIPFTRSRIETMDDRVELVTNNIAGLEPFPKYLKPLRSPKPLTAPVEFKSEEQRAKWEAAHALICKHNPNKTKDTNIDLAYDIYTPANRPYLMRFQQDFDSWERVKDIIARKMTKDGVPEAEIRQNIEMIARSHCWWDRNFKPPTDGKPFKNVFMVEGEFKGLAAGQMNLEVIGNLAHTLKGSPEEKQAQVAAAKPYLFEVAATSGVNGAYVKVVKDKLYYPIPTFTEVFDFKNTKDLVICPDGDAGRWGNFAVSGGPKNGQKIDQPGKIGVLSATVCAGNAYKRFYPHLNCKCTDISELETKHGCKGLDEVYQKAGLGIAYGAIVDSKPLTVEPLLTWGVIQQKLLDARPGQNGFEIITGSSQTQLPEI